MSNAAQQQQHKQAEGGQEQQGKQPAATPDKPGLAQVKALKDGGESGAEAVVRIIREHEDEKDDIIGWLQQHRGNAFVQLVTPKLGQVERALPQGVDLKSVRGSVTIPANRTLTGDWKASVATRQATQVQIEVSHTGVRVNCSPAIFIDATWPLKNAELYGAGITFGGKAHTDVEDGHGWGSGMISIKGQVAEKINGILDKGVAGSPLAQKGYDPTKDANLAGTLSSVEQHFQAAFAQQGGGAGGKAPVDAAEMTNVSAGGTVTLKAGGNFMKDGTGLAIDPGSDISLDAIGRGNVKDVAAAGGKPQQSADAAKISALNIGATGMKVMAKGKPIAQISSMTIHPGGNVTIDQVELLGKAAEAKAGEAGLSLLVGLLALYGHDGQAANGALQNAQDPKFVDGVTKKLMEDQFTAQIRSMILQYRTAVPGMDIAKVLGVG